MRQALLRRLFLSQVTCKEVGHRIDVLQGGDIAQAMAGAGYDPKLVLRLTRSSQEVLGVAHRLDSVFGLMDDEHRALEFANDIDGIDRPDPYMALVAVVTPG